MIEILQIFSSLLSGVLASFTPCVIVLFPILIYNYSNKNNRVWSKLLLFSISFIVSYIIFGIFLSRMITSFIKNGVIISLAIIFIFLGIMQIFKLVRNIDVKFTNNDIILGLFFAIITSTSPCTLPFFALIIGQSMNALVMLNITLFSIGLLMPPIVMLIAAKSLFFSLKKKISKVSAFIETPLNLLLILMGLYLLIRVTNLRYADIFLISVVILFLSLFFMWSLYLIIDKKDLLRIENILLFAGIAIIIYIIIVHCNSIISSSAPPSGSVFRDFINKTTSQEIPHETCSYNVNTCTYCHKCIILFLISVSAIFVSSFLIYFKRYKIKRKK